MSRPDRLCPPPPEPFPKGLLRLPPGTTSRAIGALAALLAFYAAYFAILAGAVWLLVWLWRLDLGDSRLKVLLFKYGLLLADVVFIAVLLRPLLSFSAPADDELEQIELTEVQAPHLFAFIRDVAEQVGAPMPDRVFLNYDYRCAARPARISLLGIFFPRRGDITLGLATIVLANLSELKAIVAHELAHHTQRHVFSRLALRATLITRALFLEDDLVTKFVRMWQDLPGFIGVPGYLAYKGIQASRAVFKLLFLFVQIAEQALRRRMELRADRFAVAVAGTDAFVQGLRKVVIAGNTLPTLTSVLEDLAVIGIYTDNIYYHLQQIREREERLSRKTQDDEGVVFRPSEDRPYLDLTADHPEFYAREVAAKRWYVPAPIDSRPAHLVLQGAEWTYRELTRLFYRYETNHDPTELRPAKEVARYVEAELADKQALGRYQGYFVAHPAFIGSAAVLRNPRRLPATEIEEFLKEWPDEELLRTVAQYQERREQYFECQREIAKLYEEAAEAEDRSEPDPAAVQRLQEKQAAIQRSLLELEERLQEADRRFLEVHLSMAMTLEKYGFHWLGELRQLAAFQGWIARLMEEIYETMQRSLTLLSMMRLTKHLNWNELKAEFDQTVWRLGDLFEEIRPACTPKLGIVPEGTSVYEWIMRDTKLDTGVLRDRNRISVLVVIDQIDHVDTAFNRLYWLHCTGLAVLIRCCDRIALQWKTLYEKAKAAKARTSSPPPTPRPSQP